MKIYSQLKKIQTKKFFIPVPSYTIYKCRIHVKYCVNPVFFFLSVCCLYKLISIKNDSILS